MNTILHAFGWAIVVEVERGEITGAYPARVRFRGFDEVSNTTGYQNVARYMKEEADQLIEEASNHSVYCGCMSYVDMENYIAEHEITCPK